RPSADTPRVSAGSSRSASSGPIGPGTSRSSMPAVLPDAVEKCVHDHRELSRPRDRTKVPGMFEDRRTCILDEQRVITRLAGIDYEVQRWFAVDNQRRTDAPPAIRRAIV